MIPDEFWRIAQWIVVVLLALAATGCVSVLYLIHSVMRH